MQRPQKRQKLSVELFENADLLVELDLVCPICRNVVEDTVVTSCAHIFCANCLERAFEGGRRCPTCRNASVKVDRSATMRSYVNRLIARQRIRCPNGCDWVGDMTGMGAHADRCPNVDVECPECTMRIRRRDQEAHSQIECPMRHVVCPRCSESVLLSAFEMHDAVFCPRLPACCAYCNLEVTNERVSAHEDQCPERLVPCDLAFMGCGFADQRKHMDVHMAAVSHRDLISAHREQHRGLLERSAMIESLVADGKLLRTAIRDLHPDALRTLHALGVNLNETLNGCTALHIAVEKCSADVVRTLLELNADANAQTALARNTPLHIAVTTQRLNNVRVLIEFGANPDAVNRSGHSPLQLAFTQAMREALMERNVQ